jgi:hypothetical protein
MPALHTMRMFHARLHLPQLAPWQGRLGLAPRWAWIAFLVGAAIPVAVLAILTLAAAALTGVIVLLAVLPVWAVLGLVSRLLHLFQPDDGRRNVSIVVRSARVIDP